MGDLDQVGRNLWKSSDLVELGGEKGDEWEGYMKLLESNFISLREDEDDTLFWSGNENSRAYTTKLGYFMHAKEVFTCEII